MPPSQQLPQYGGGAVETMRSLTVSSKLSSGKWPHADGVAKKIVRTLQQWGALRQQVHRQRTKICSPSGNWAQASESSDRRESCAGPDTGAPGTAQAGFEMATRHRQDSSGEGSIAATALAPASSGEALPAAHDIQNHTVVELSEPAGYPTHGGPVGSGSGFGGPENRGAKNCTDEHPDSIDNSTPQKPCRSVFAANRSGMAVISANAPSLETFTLSVEDVLAEVSGELSTNVPTSRHLRNL